MNSDLRMWAFLENKDVQYPFGNKGVAVGKGFVCRLYQNSNIHVLVALYFSSISFSNDMSQDRAYILKMLEIPFKQKNS